MPDCAVCARVKMDTSGLSTGLSPGLSTGLSSGLFFGHQLYLSLRFFSFFGDDGVAASGGFVFFSGLKEASCNISTVRSGRGGGELSGLVFELG